VPNCAVKTILKALWLIIVGLSLEARVVMHPATQ
jgi:hypothetical protein